MGYCYDEVMFTTGQILYSFSQMFAQKSCKPNTGNAGNWYSFPGATAGGSKSSGNEVNSICPKGWMLTTNETMDMHSYNFVLKRVYNKVSNNITIGQLPLSFPSAGYYYYGSLNDRDGHGYYLSSRAYKSDSIYYLYFYATGLSTQRTSYAQKLYGYSVRCVAH